MRAGLKALRDAGDTTTFEGMDPDGELGPFVTRDEDLAAAVDGDSIRIPQTFRPLRYTSFGHLIPIVAIGASGCSASQTATAVANDNWGQFAVLIPSAGGSRTTLKESAPSADQHL